VAIAQFSDDPRTEFKLNSYSNKHSLLEAIHSITYKGGNTKTGEELDAPLRRDQDYLFVFCIYVYIQCFLVLYFFTILHMADWLSPLSDACP